MRHLFTALALLGAAACSRSDGTLLTVVAEGEAKAAPDVADLTLGVTTEGWVEVASGLAEAERVVVSGHAALRPGAAVQVSGPP